MVNLRIIDIQVFDSVTIQARFTANLDPLINTDNVEIVANTPGIPNPKVLIIDINNDVIIITTQPMTPYGVYFVTFKSTTLIRFKSKDGTAYLFEDGVTNVKLILGTEDPADPIRESLTTYLKDNIYNLDPGSITRDIINTQSSYLSKALYDIRQSKNDNYLGFLIEDEKHIRGKGPFDRLNEEGAYEIIRVGTNKTGATTTTSFNFTEFPSGPITLLSTSVSNEKLTAGAGDSTFDGLVLTVSKTFVTKLKKVQIIYQNSSIATYDLNIFGYQILIPDFDLDVASPLFTLTNNQFKLSDAILNSSFILPKAGDFIYVDYEYQFKGRVIDETTVSVSQVLDATREVVPPILTEFTLEHFPIVSSADIIQTSNGIQFLDPSSNPPFSSTHPAFVKEIIFKFDRLPKRVGEYTVDYNTGRVFCYGAIINDGTGDFPPIATYKYRKTFSPRLDYTYDSDLSELVASPLRNLIGQEAKITFSYELVLVPDIDYIAQVHSESLDERIENRLKASNALSVKNVPITDVFRIYNETSGELYKIQRWNDSTIFFTSSTSPNIVSQLGERVSFIDIINELLIVNIEIVNILSIKVFSFEFQNNRIVSASEDVLGASFNSSVSFSRSDIFVHELFYDNYNNVNFNINRLLVGQYQIDYLNGLLYVGVSSIQNYDLGTVNYKKYTISPQHSHVISVSEIYNNISSISGINKIIEYSTFGEGSVQPISFDIASERFLNGDQSFPYIVDTGTIIVTDDIKDVRNIFDLYDLQNNNNPTNFANNVTIASNIITLDPIGIQKQENLIIQTGGILHATSFSVGAEIISVTSVHRVNDNADLWQTPGNFSGFTITLSGVNSPLPGQQVVVIYNVILNSAATPIVDYNRGDYFIDYTYLADEILVSYEYGDNNLDFRKGTLDVGKEYFVTYKAGALRQALLQNFGTLIDLPILNSLDTTFPRENYRDALKAALQSFTKGPTIPSMKLIVENISHIEPELIESAFQNWSLGLSHLYLDNINTNGTFSLLAGKYDLGVLIDTPGQTINFPTSSNLRLEEGTLETWIIPEWNGLDNDASLTFKIYLNNSILSVSNIYIGADSHHPEYNNDNVFTVNRTDTISPIGLPSSIYTKIGIFIYYDENEKRWKVYAKDTIISNNIYSGTIQSSGEVYDVKFIPGLGELDDIVRSDIDKIEFVFNINILDGYSPDGYNDGYFLDGYKPGDGYAVGYSFDGISFMADDEHYIFDFGKTDTTNRFSLFKDGKGYLNFRVYDKGNKIAVKNQFKVSSDISSWQAGSRHFIAISWRLNSLDHRDEMHLFIDGFEMPNIMRYGGRPSATSSDRFRTVKPEIVAGTIPKTAIAGNDLSTTAGSSIVISASVNFQSEGILAGDSIAINELGFTIYNILNVAANILTLDSPTPSTFSNARFSVNQYSTIVSSEIDLYNNIAVSILHNNIETEIGGLRAVIPEYAISKNGLNQNILTILGSANAGDQILIRTLGLNHRRVRDRQFIWGNTSSVLKTQLPSPINLDEVSIICVPLPLVTIGPSNTTIVTGMYQAILHPSQTTNNTEGRSLSIRITGGNYTFSPNPVTVQINGTTAAGPLFEIVTFTSIGTKNTINKFKTITSTVVRVKPIVVTKDFFSLEVKEVYAITTSEGNNIYPVIRFSYKTQHGKNLSGIVGNATVTDSIGFFAASNVGQKLVIISPLTVAGTYTIESRIDDNNITITPTPSFSFNNAIYDIYNVTLGRSGFQNGFFTLEQAGTTNTPFVLSEGMYEFDFSTYLQISLDPLYNVNAFIGSDINGQKQAKAILDEFRILSTRLTDVRVGEVIASNQDSITTNFNHLKKFTANSNTLMLLHFDSFPFINSADYWISTERDFLQSGTSINENFGQSLAIIDRPLIVDNAGLFSTSSEGSIEFWVSPKFDTYNDPNIRMYFDASSTIIEEIVSVTSGIVKVTGRISDVLSIRLISDTTNTGIDYFNKGEIESDFQTIRLNKSLPYQQTPVKVNYIPSGILGNRISIYKDLDGFITFNVRSNGNDFQVRQPVFWSRDTWHRILVTYKFNRSDNKDELRLFIDGEERGVILFGTGYLFGDDIVFGQGFSGAVSDIALIADINFTDPINQFFIGSDYFRNNLAQARIDNLRLSNIARRPISIAGELTDVNFSSNIDIVFPVISDIYTTYLLNFDSMLIKADDFALLKNEQFGIFDFTLNIIDSFGIISGNAKIKQVLEILISALKPAQSRATINYIK